MRYSLELSLSISLAFHSRQQTVGEKWRSSWDPPSVLFKPFNVKSVMPTREQTHTPLTHSRKKPVYKPNTLFS